MRIFNWFSRRPQKEKVPQVIDEYLCIWEDDYLMRVLVPASNMSFVKEEAERIEQFTESHFDGAGLTDITQIGKLTEETINKLIPIEDCVSVISNSGMHRVTKIWHQSSGFMDGENLPLAFGNASFAVVLDQQGSLLKNIWITGYIGSDENLKSQTIAAVTKLVENHDLIGVNWYTSNYYAMNHKDNVLEFVNDCC